MNSICRYISRPCLLSFINKTQSLFICICSHPHTFTCLKGSIRAAWTRWTNRTVLFDFCVSVSIFWHFFTLILDHALVHIMSSFVATARKFGLSKSGEEPRIHLSKAPCKYPLEFQLHASPTRCKNAESKCYWLKIPAMYKFPRGASRLL